MGLQTEHKPTYIMLQNLTMKNTTAALVDTRTNRNGSYYFSYLIKQLRYLLYLLSSRRPNEHETTYENLVLIDKDVVARAARAVGS
jgi:hypothetical protein